MFIVTNRELNPRKSGLEQFGKRPNPQGPNELRMVEVTGSRTRMRVDIVPDELNATWKRKGRITNKWLESMGLDPAEPTFGSIYVARKLFDAVNPVRSGASTRRKGRDLLLFVHGFNNDLEDVVTRARGFERNYGVEVLVFSWPANGGGVAGTASYLSDKNDARASVGALDRTLAKVGDMLGRFHGAWSVEVQAEAAARFPDNAEQRQQFVTRLVEKGCPFTVNLVLHSMGNYLYKQLMLSTAALSRGITFDNVTLVAADTNNEDHARWVDRIPARRRVFVTINEKDSALRASRLKFGAEQLARLGHWVYDLDASRATYVDFTGATKVGSSHAYFEGDPLQNAAVKRFFRESFRGDAAEQRLPFDVAKNVYRIKR